MNPETNNNEPGKVLIIDDESDICYLLSTLLKQKNFDTAFVNSLTEAQSALPEVKPAVIFLDNHLPDGLGLNFIGHIRQVAPSTKIIMITAHDTQTDRQRAINEGVDYFIGKPFTRDIIYKAVDDVIN
jgi:two-component system, OmpR family, response regulator